MPLFVQHGHGKSDKITEALSRGDIQGVILAPRNEKPENLASCVADFKAAGAEHVMVDPQLYISTFAPANVRYLPEYDHFPTGPLGASDFTLKRTREFAKGMIDFQREMDVTTILSPTVMFDSFSDRWCQIAINLADASLEYYASISDSTPLQISFVMAEDSLTAEEEINRFLDTVTQEGWSMGGFYLVPARKESSYNQDFDSEKLSNLLYMVHVLGAVNELEVVMGYTDFLGIPLRAAGATAFATGWSQGLRQFVRKNFLKKLPGGQQPRDRYSSGPLLNSIFLQELQEVYEIGRLSEALSGVPLDEVITEAANPMAAPWNMNLSQHHHWQTLNELDKTLKGRPRTDTRNVLRLVSEAIAIYAIFESDGIEFSRYTGAQHLHNWRRGISDFARRAGFTS